MTRLRPLVIVCGVRPQYIKAAALLYEINHSTLLSGLESYVFDTGQHYDECLSKNIKEDLGLEPNYTVKHKTELRSSLSIMGTAITELGTYLRKILRRKPVVLVFGDANPALVGAVCASQLNLDLIHIEAGARRSPFEIEHRNSKIVDSVASLKGCVTQRAINELKKESLSDGSFLSGDVAHRWMKNNLKKISVQNQRRVDYIIVSIHRKSNQKKERLDSFFESIRKFPDETFVFLQHPSLRSLLSTITVPSNCEILESQPYSLTLQLLHYSKFCLTDSGGLSREASILMKRVVMCRDSGGWPELEENDLLIRCSIDDPKLINAIKWGVAGANLNLPSSPLVVSGGVDLCMEKLFLFLRIGDENY